MKQLISFFKGNTTLIEQEILQQIEKAVSSQHFEWAATLRDIYRHIAQVVERQHVELPKNIQGYVVEIRTIGAWNIFVLLHFYEGKLVDVIREKTPLADGDAYWMLA
jgi:excinuclease UvrABC nuclease subunit